jgi:hypothetical protein
MPPRKTPSKEDFEAAVTVTDSENGAKPRKRGSIFNEPVRHFCKARGCTDEISAAVVRSPDDKIGICDYHYRLIVKNLVEVPWGPLELTGA